MTFREREIDLEEEIERIEAERQDLAATVAEMAEDNPQRQRKAQNGAELDAHLDGLEWALSAHEDGDVPQWDTEVESITLAGLTGGEFGAMGGEIAEGAQRGQSAQQVQRVAKVRMGTVDAPYLDGAQSDTQEIAAVAGLPIGFLRWADAKIDELSSVGNGERRDFASLLVEKEQEQPTK
jgi:hypothetical protein